ncbi:MAG TPA: hypothetical protein VGJ48_03955, partial [Pyrinomonadaceae bacterium]
GTPNSFAAGALARGASGAFSLAGRVIARDCYRFARQLPFGFPLPIRGTPPPSASLVSSNSCDRCCLADQLTARGFE